MAHQQLLARSSGISATPTSNTVSCAPLVRNRPLVGTKIRHSSPRRKFHEAALGHSSFLLSILCAVGAALASASSMLLYGLEAWIAVGVGMAASAICERLRSRRVQRA